MKAQMAVKELARLPQKDLDLVMRTPALVSVLIAGADHNIEKREIIQAIKAVHYRSLMEGDFLNRYYHAIDGTMEAECYHIMQKFENSPEEREAYITETLSRHNSILPQIERRYAGDLVKSWRSLARSVAKASGGFLGFERISLEESHFVDLKMITYKP
jgi:hypothetical protein